MVKKILNTSSLNHLVLFKKNRKGRRERERERERGVKKSEL